MSGSAFQRGPNEPIGDDHPLRPAIIGALRDVRDPEIPVSIYELGLIYEIHIDDAAHVRIIMTLTTPNCPVAEQIPQDVKRRVEAVEGVSACDVELTWEPAWTTDRLSEPARLELEFTGLTGPEHLRGPRTTGLTVGRKPTDRR